MLIVHLGNFLSGSVVKNLPCNAGDLGLISGLGRSPGKGKSYSLQYSGLENSIHRGVWQVTVHGFKELDMTACVQNTVMPHIY